MRSIPQLFIIHFSLFIIKSRPALQEMQAGRTIIPRKLGFLDSFGGALIGAGAAADADIGIDDVLVFALGNSLDGALLSAGTALDTCIGNVESHGVTSLWKKVSVVLYKHTCILTWIWKNAIPFLKKIVYFQI